MLCLPLLLYHYPAVGFSWNTFYLGRNRNNIHVFVILNTFMVQFIFEWTYRDTYICNRYFVIQEADFIQFAARFHLLCISQSIIAFIPTFLSLAGTSLENYIHDKDIPNTFLCSEGLLHWSARLTWSMAIQITERTFLPIIWKI